MSLWKTNNLWILGDSFAEEVIPDRNTWPNMMPNLLNVEKTHLLGKGGSSLGYTYNKFHEIKSDVDANDVIIVMLTDLKRRWFFEDKPELASFSFPQNSDTLSEKGVTPEQIKAIREYMKYLDNFDTQDHVNLYNFLANLNYVCDRKKAKAIVIAAFLDCENSILSNHANTNFANIHFAEGNMVNDVSIKEFSHNIVNDWAYCRRLLEQDARICHLSMRNHYVMADKITKYINYNIHISLKTEFQQYFITRDHIHDKTFWKAELYENDWWKRI